MHTTWPITDHTAVEPIDPGSSSANTTSVGTIRERADAPRENSPAQTMGYVDRVRERGAFALHREATAVGQGEKETGGATVGDEGEGGSCAALRAGGAVAVASVPSGTVSGLPEGDISSLPSAPFSPGAQSSSATHGDSTQTHTIF